MQLENVPANIADDLRVKATIELKALRLLGKFYVRFIYLAITSSKSTCFHGNAYGFCSYIESELLEAVI